jgi:large subunit ribosomal protein L22
MEFRVKLGKAPFSARKAKYVLDLIRGKNVNTVLDVLQFCHRRPARAIEKLTRSCMANVEYNNENEAKKGAPEVDVDMLVLTEARADEGPLLGYARRFMPRARGMAFPLNLRTCHIKLTFTASEAEEEKEEKKKEEKEEKVEKKEKAEKTEKAGKTEEAEKTKKAGKAEKVEKEKVTAGAEEETEPASEKPAKKRAKKVRKAEKGEDD